MEVRPEYIRAFFEEIGKRYQSREHFYQTALDLDRGEIDKLKDRYLHQEINRALPARVRTLHRSRRVRVRGAGAGRAGSR